MELNTAYPKAYPLQDQRFAATRPDVLVYLTAPLEEDLTLVGPVSVGLHVSTSGTDSDWVVKLVDVYSGDYPENKSSTPPLKMAGYQQLVRGEVMRGKFRRSMEKPEPFEPGRITGVSFGMQDIFHTFRRGHCIMVQVQSSWFPLVDRNPQTFVNIPTARESDFQKAVQRVYHSKQAASSISVLVLPAGPN
jgi:putative CocE/NonD family hydrolase